MLKQYDDLIFDFGLHNGKDSRFYLDKGFRVVAFEANPILASQSALLLADYLESGQLIIENVGIGEVEGTFPFYRNLDNDEWSSFRKAVGTRENTQFDVLDIKVIPAAQAIQKYGMPYYMKIDIEGHDYMVVRALKNFNRRPKYLSMEDSGPYCLKELEDVGAKRVKFQNQTRNHQIKLPNPPLEGAYVEVKFGGTMSGPFGRELPGEWISMRDAQKIYPEKIRPVGGPPLDGWWDIHVTFEDESG